MTIARVDCQAGASGNMFLGALLDTGLDREELEAQLRTLDLPPWRLTHETVRKGSLSATHMDFELHRAQAEGSFGDATSMEEVIAASDIAPQPRARAQQMIRRLTAAEAIVHGIEPSQVHFHELGAVDFVLDIVGACVAVDMLDITSMSTSPINTGSGTVSTSHGVMPVPAPATMQILCGSSLEVYAADLAFELLTPTGALLLTEFTTPSSYAPPMRVTATGYGAGTADLSIPNVLRVTLGERTGSLDTDVVTVIETNIDDMNPEHYPAVTKRLFESGALDVTLASLTMKKGRPGTLIQVLIAPDKSANAVDVLLHETSTLGVRMHDARRVTVPRLLIHVDTPYGGVQVKASYIDGRLRDVAPEADDCARAAHEHSVKVQAVYDAARDAAFQAAPQDQPTEGAPNE
jgi:uncharacterized protein (TIGR00299 family) protein